MLPSDWFIHSGLIELFATKLGSLYGRLRTTATWRAIKIGARLTAHAAPPSPSRQQRDIRWFAVRVKR